MKALLLVDIQKDFLPGGSLGVKNANDLIPTLNELAKQDFDFILASKDWHPENHGSFASTHNKKVGEHILLDKIDQVLWPSHCVQNHVGSEFADQFNTDRIRMIFYKGVDPNVDSYSAFFDNEHKRSTGLHEYLEEMGIQELYIAGLTTDYCVKYSVLDAIKLGYTVYVIQDACRPVNLKPGDEADAIEKMKQAGAKIIQSRDLLKD